MLVQDYTTLVLLPTKLTSRSAGTYKSTSLTPVLFSLRPIFTKPIKIYLQALIDYCDDRQEFIPDH
jgi:hypothetical protein